MSSYEEPAETKERSEAGVHMLCVCVCVLVFVKPPPCESCLCCVWRAFARRHEA